MFEALNLIDGELRSAQAGGWLESIDPAREVVHGRAPASTREDVDAAVSAARRAQPEWGAASVWERAGVLRSLAAAIRRRGDDIIELEARDTGNVSGKLSADVQIAAGYLEYFAGLGSEMKGETVPATADNLHFTLREPYGVVARIVPFNHPFMFAAAHLAAPLMAGNTVVVKTPEQSPLTGGVLSELCAEVLPSGVVNVLSGTGVDVGDPLVRHPTIRRIGFTGSVPTGLAIQRSAAEVGVKHVSLELGGKNPLIALPDADAQAVADAAVAGMNFAWAGQSCGSTSRLLVHESIYDDVVSGVAQRLEGLKPGDPLDPSSEMGPVNNAAHFQRLVRHIDAAKNTGIDCVTGGTRPKGAAYERGYWLLPTLFGDVPNDAAIAREELFGPVLVAQRWRDREQAISMANDSPFGLTAAVWGNKLNEVMGVVRALDAGYVWVNGVAQHYVGMPFGGRGDSGLGSEECLAELLSYTQSKSVNVLLP